MDYREIPRPSGTEYLKPHEFKQGALMRLLINVGKTIVVLVGLYSIVSLILFVSWDWEYYKNIDPMSDAVHHIAEVKNNDAIFRIECTENKNLIATLRVKSCNGRNPVKLGSGLNFRVDDRAQLYTNIKPYMGNRVIVEGENVWDLASSINTGADRLLIRYVSKDGEKIESMRLTDASESINPVIKACTRARKSAW